MNDLQYPTRFSPPLSGVGSEDFPTHGDWLLRLVDLVWQLPGGTRLCLDPWQRWLIRHMLEVYPKGHPRAGELRYRQIVVSMGRQNGKSILGAILGLYGLVREAGALVIGIASSADQASIIYTRLLAVIKQHKSLSNKFDRLTNTRGISAKDGGRYLIKASKSAAVQGLDLSAGLCDELHLLKPELWSDMVNGTRARKNGFVAGLTTAGDDSSTLLKSLYATMDEGNERFGYFVWEAPEARVPQDDATFGEWLKQANPAIACGRVDLETVIGDLRIQPDADVIRYGLNRFVASSNGLFTATQWAACAAEFDKGSRPVFTIDRTPEWEYATITATWREGEYTRTEVVASVVKPSIEKLAALCVQLSTHNPLVYAADGITLKGLINELKKRGLPAVAANFGDVLTAASLLYSKVAQRKLQHANDPLLNVQIPRTKRKNVGEQFKISRTDSSVEIDAVLSMMLGVYFAETTTDVPMQIF